MKALKNIVVGFLVSFVGSIPLGYLNIVGYQIYEKNGIDSVNLYLCGVVAVEAIVIYFTLVFANRLSENKKLLKAIEFFSVAFLLALAYVFWAQSKAGPDNHDYLSRYANHSPFVIGLILNSLNFVQLPFWIGWNLYLINAAYIAVSNGLKYIYIIGTLIGTFVGMLCFVLFLNLVAQKSDSISGYLMSHIVPLFFVGFALLQAWRIYKKYYSSDAAKK